MSAREPHPRSDIVPRRRFLASVLAASAGAFLPAKLLALGGGGRQATLRVGVITGPATSERALAGIALGRAEAVQSASLFGKRVELETRRVNSPADAAAAATSLGGEWHAAAIVCAVAEAVPCGAVASAGGEMGVPVLNTLCPSDALRGEECQAALFHIVPSDAMRRDALAIAKRNHPESRRRTASARIVAWHPSLEKFGAEQLNQRFRASAHEEMDDDAWAGWLALKILLESTLRVSGPGGQALRAYLLREDARFDGHKGVPLSFRTWDRQLRQPLYVVSGDRVAEVPGGGADDSNARDRLDRLGPDSARSTCPRDHRNRE